MDNVVRSYLPGSEWMSTQLYASNIVADDIITCLIPQFLSCLAERGIDVEKWFFIRYSQPDFHIRFRVCFQNPNNSGIALMIFNKVVLSYFENEKIWRVLIDTYNRELERYGYSIITEAESIFFYESVFAMKFLSYYNQLFLAPYYRWLIAIKIIDDLLLTFEYTSKQIRDLFLSLSESTKRQFGYDTHNNCFFSNRYRKYKIIVENVINNTDSVICDSHISFILKERVQDISKHVSIIKNYFENDERGLNGFISSIIHMNINRVMRYSPNSYELVLYDFMYRFYQSKIIRENM